MADEATVRGGLQIRKTDANGVTVIDYASRPTAFTADVTGTKGPSPGAVNVSRNGTDISFAQLTTPGLARIMNQSPDYYVEYGVRDLSSGIFYPIGELLPGESYPLRFSRNLQEEYVGTGTGTGAATLNSFHMRAEWAAGTAGVDVLVEAFEK